MVVQLTDGIRLLAFDWGPIDYWTKFTGGRNCDIYVPSLRARACARDPATIVALFTKSIALNDKVAR